MADSFQVTYLLSLSKEDIPHERILSLQLEQSAELPDPVLTKMGGAWVKGEITKQYQPDDHHLIVTIAWPQSNHADEITQFLNLLFGNISMKQGITILDIEWNTLVPNLFTGPSWGITRIRNDWNIPDRALSCTALKPMGHTNQELAKTAGAFARGGIDIIKDDHGLTNQVSAPFQQRVSACVQEMDRAAQITGRRSRYFTNITTDPHHIPERYELAAELGADGVLLAPMLCGPALMHHLAQSTVDLPIMAHPAFSGTYIAADPGISQIKEGADFPKTNSPSSRNDLFHGFEPGLFYGAVFRALGADFVIYPNSGGRFSFSPHTCRSINKELRRRDLPFEPGFPTPGGGMQRNQMNRWLAEYGPDTTFLIGGNLYEDPMGIEAASRAFADSILQI